jgi:hypothetical protein
MCGALKEHELIAVQEVGLKKELLQDQLLLKTV